MSYDFVTITIGSPNLLRYQIKQNNIVVFESSLSFEDGDYNAQSNAKEECQNWIDKQKEIVSSKGKKND